MILVKVRSRDLVKAGACLSGRARFREMFGREGINVEWGPLAALWAITDHHGQWLLQRGLLPPVSFREARIPALDLSRSDLEGLSFLHATVSGGDWRSANLRRADLRSTAFTRTDLSNAVARDAIANNLYCSNVIAQNVDLSHATLRGACLSGDFRYAIFTSAALACSRLEGDFQGAYFSGADLTEAYLPSSTNFAGATYDGNTRFPASFDPLDRGMVRTCEQKGAR